MPNTSPTQLLPNSLPRRVQRPEAQQLHRSVWQDNPAPPRARTATPQPASPSQAQRSRQLQTKHPRTSTRPTRKRKTVQLVVWVKPVVKAELQRLAEAEGLSVSATGAALLENALQDNLHTQHAVLLDPIIEKAIGKHMRAYSNRLAVLLVRSLFTAEQTRSFVYNLLVRHPGMTDEHLTKIKTGASTSARANITRITPQLQTLIEAVQQWLENVEQEVKINE